MTYVSTRTAAPAVALSDAIRAGLAADGGLYIPSRLPDLSRIEPQRRDLIPGFQAVKSAALERGALGCSISGAGPSVFAWAEESTAAAIRDGMVAAFAANGLEADAWIAPIESDGASVVDR